MANIELFKVRVEDDTGKKAFYMHTSTDVVFDSTGKNVDTLLNDINKEINSIKDNGVQVADTLPLKSQMAWNDDEPIPDGYVAVEPPFVNDNLLVNSDFRSGIINQKGQTSYNPQAPRLYGIDMWAATMMKVTINDGYVRIENNDTKSHSFVQYLGGDYKEEYTWYVNVKDCTQGTYLWCDISKNDTKYSTIGNLVKGENIFQYGKTSQTFCSFGISIPAGGIAELYCCKLEKGSFFTGMPTVIYPNELAKCQYWYERKAFDIYKRRKIVADSMETERFEYSHKGNLPKIKFNIEEAEGCHIDANRICYTTSTSLDVGVQYTNENTHLKGIIEIDAYIY